MASFHSASSIFPSVTAKLFVESLIEAKLLKEKDVEEYEAKALAEVDRCVEYAENSPFPDESELFTDVYA